MKRLAGSGAARRRLSYFHIRGQDVVVTRENGEFVTVLKGGVENARVKKARGQ